MTGQHSVIAAGDFQVNFEFAAVNGGAQTTINGFKLEGTMVSAQQLLDNSKIVALANGNTVTVTNTNNSGSLTFNVTDTDIDTTTKASDGSPEGGSGTQSLIGYAMALKRAGDSRGGIITITNKVNGADVTRTFYSCTLRSCPPLILAGNDVPDYQVVFNYGDMEDSRTSG